MRPTGPAHGPPDARRNPSLGWVRGALDTLERDGLRRERRVGTGLPAGTIDFGSNDYLGLAADPRVCRAAAEAAGKAWGGGASPVVSGRSATTAELERRLAEFEGVEAALIFPSGFAANAGTIPALVDAGDALYADAKNHASLIDGCRLSRAERRVYRHNDTGQLATLLAGDSGRFRRRLIVTDSLFSMDGDFAPLPELAELAEAYDAMLVVDEAHASGVWGDRGRGGVERAAATAVEVERRVAARLGTLSKAFGSMGGFVAGSAELVDWLANRARSYVYSTAAPAAVAAASVAALEIAQAEPHRRAEVQRLASLLRQRLAAAGWDTGVSASQIVPIFVGSAEAAVALSARLALAGLFVPAIRPPSVPHDESLLRVSVTFAHREEDLDRLLGALGEAGEPTHPA